MTYENILVESLDGHVGLIRLNRPQALNALNAALMSELTGALEHLDRDESIRCLVLTGSDRVFAAGADIRELADQTSVDMLTRDSIRLWDKIAAVKKPIIAAVSGWCLGGGNELAMVCDMIVASKSAKFGQPEVNLGVIPGAGGTQRLARAVGKVIAMEMVLNNRTLSADEAYQFGLVNRVSETYLDDAIQLAREIAQRAPLAVRLGKECVNRAFETPLSMGVAAERRDFYFLFSTEDQREGMDAFANKRAPQWKGK
ncbi:MAG TPA: enoyl-CoA hydratase-related protein [Aggregatilineales bacterium]|nr:enoyl-CoA hydratase-related protein [Aggregatilineales bacterium]